MDLLACLRKCVHIPGQHTVIINAVDATKFSARKFISRHSEIRIGAGRSNTSAF